MVAALTGSVSQPTVSRMLREMVHSGLVERVPGGYVVNRRHLAFPAIEVLYDAVEELGRRVRTEVGSWPMPPVSVVLFGSAARGEAEPSSDVDLLVVRPSDVTVEDPAWADDVAHLAEMVRVWTGAPCEILEYDVAELQELAGAGDPLVATLRRDGVTFAGDAVSDLLQTVTR
jgi:hypothetical protein